MAKSQLSIPELKKFLKASSGPELISIIMDCYKLNDEVKKYFQMKLQPEEALNQLFEEAQKKITAEFYPDRGEPKLRLAQAKKAITDFGKLTDDLPKLLELMLHYVEMGVEFTNDYGDIDERFYNSMISMYGQVTKKLIDNDDVQLYNAFQKRLYAAVTDTVHIGWGFHDCLGDLYYNIEGEYGDGEEDEEE